MGACTGGGARVARTMVPGSVGAMAEDRLDDAIDAVVRAVDRIERATRGQRHAEAGDRVAFDDAAIARELRPPATGVAPGRGAWEPELAGAARGDATPPSKKRKGKKGKRKTHRDAALPQAELAVSTTPVVDAADEPGGAPGAPQPPTPPVSVESAPAPAPVQLAALARDAGVGGSAGVHELLGHVVMRTQELDDHLAAARRLRGEINELVARLAAAATNEP
jgi:hypothetical protein